jgi:hypothetical protein
VAKSFGFVFNPPSPFFNLEFSYDRDDSFYRAKQNNIDEVVVVVDVAVAVVAGCCFIAEL